MKKVYSAPEIVFDDFALSTSISAGCERVVNTLQQFSCGVDYPLVGVIFTSNATGCKVEVTDGGKWSDGYCYHIPEADKNMFTS